MLRTSHTDAAVKGKGKTMSERTMAGAPAIHNVHGKIASLQRRQAFLARRLNERGGSPNALDRDGEEEKALREGALPALLHYWREVEGEATATALLSGLVDAIRGKQEARGTEQHREADAALEEATRHAFPFVDNLPERG